MSISFSIVTAIGATVATTVDNRPSSLSPTSSPPFLRTPLSAGTHYSRFRSAAKFHCSHADIPKSSDLGSNSGVNNDSHGKDESSRGSSSNEILIKLKRYGISGVLSYGLLNTAYYLTTFLVVWFYVVPAPGRMGYLAAVERFLKIMAMVWAGSQVTKLVRAGGALALAPFVDRGLSWFTVKFGFQSQGKAFMAIAGVCFGLAFLMFLTVTILSA